MTPTHLLEGSSARRHGARAQPPGHRPTWVEVDLDAISRNTATLKAASRARLLLAAVKADGYGHGLVPAANAAIRGGADWLGVALIEEAEVLRAAGVFQPVLMLNEPPVAAIPAMVEARVTPVVYTRAFVDALDSHGRGRGVAHDVHLKLDTGMRRVGVPDADWEGALRHLATARGVRVQGVMSHLAVADEPDAPFTAVQASRFEQGVALARQLGHAPDIVHLANSAGTLTGSEYHHDMVRPGIAIYGLDPGGGLARTAGLTPALTWWSRVSLVKRVEAGESIGYGLVWTAQRDTTIATIPVGYGDGLRRALTNRGQVVLGGQRVRISGRVSMDQTLLEIPEGAPVAIGDEVALIGAQGGVGVTAGDWARWLDTITYEVATSITGRVPRAYLDLPGEG